MENNEYESTPYVKFEYTTQEAKKKSEPISSSVEDQYFDLPLKERMKIQKKRIKQNMKVKSHELKAKAKIQKEKFQAKSKELGGKIRKKNHQINQKIHTKIEVHKMHKQQNQQKKNHPQSSANTTEVESSKYCSECGHRVSFSGKFCASCGSTQ